MHLRRIPLFNTTKGRIIATDLASKSDRPWGEAGAVRLVLDKPADPSWHYVGTFDNNATISQIRFLARIATALDEQAGAPLILDTIADLVPHVLG